MADPHERNENDDAMRRRLAELSQDLKKSTGPAGGKPTGTEASAAGMGSAMSLGFRVMSEFVAAVVVGALIGWQIDKWIGSSPAALIIFTGLGTAAGFWSVYRVASKPGSR